MGSRWWQYCCCVNRENEEKHKETKIQMTIMCFYAGSNHVCMWIRERQGKGCQLLKRRECCEGQKPPCGSDESFTVLRGLLNIYDGRHDFLCHCFLLSVRLTYLFFPMLACILLIKNTSAVLFFGFFFFFSDPLQIECPPLKLIIHSYINLASYSRSCFHLCFFFFFLLRVSKRI